MHGDNGTNIGCPECGCRNWYCTSNDKGEDVGFCEYCSHEWPLDFWELEEILEMTKPLPS